MSGKMFDKNEHIEQDRKTEKENIELAFKKLCEFEQHHCEVIYENSSGNIVYVIDPARLAALENIPENDLKQYDFNTIEFSSYESLFESKYKQRFLKNVAAIQPSEIEKILNSDTLDQVLKRDKDLREVYLQINKEKDLDNDGVPDRIDIDDTRNSVQTVHDLDIVKNTSSKETGRDQAERKEKKYDELEL